MNSTSPRKLLELAQEKDVRRSTSGIFVGVVLVSASALAQQPSKLEANTRPCISTVKVVTFPVPDSEFLGKELVADFSVYSIANLRELFAARNEPPTPAGCYVQDWGCPNCRTYVSDLRPDQSPHLNLPSSYGVVTKAYSEAAAKIRDEKLKKAKDGL
jgi:hypothetical protein